MKSKISYSIFELWHFSALVEFFDRGKLFFDRRIKIFSKAQKTFSARRLNFKFNLKTLFVLLIFIFSILYNRIRKKFCKTKKVFIPQKHSRVWKQNKKCQRKKLSLANDREKNSIVTGEKNHLTLKV